MGKKTKEEILTEWIATQNIARFQELLNAETDDGRYKILEMLLEDEFRKSNGAPLP